MINTDEIIYIGLPLKRNSWTGNFFAVDTTLLPYLYYFRANN